MNKGYFYIETNEYEKLSDPEYRAKQSAKFIRNPNNRTKQLIVHYLENYLYIDEVQHWIIQEAANYEPKVAKMSDQAYQYVSIRKHLHSSNEELSLYRKSLFEILL